MKALTTEQLSVFFQGRFCGCGNPETAAASMLRFLAEFEEDGERLAGAESWIGDEGAALLIAYWLDRVELLDHGTSVNTARLTEKGERVLGGLRREQADGFDSLFDRTRCVHGVNMDGDDVGHRCGDSGVVDPFAP